MFACGMHQPVEWDFYGLLPDITTTDVTESHQQQHQGLSMSQPMATTPNPGRGNSSTDTPVAPTPPQLQAPSIVPAQNNPQVSQAASAPIAQTRDSAKRERPGFRRARSTTLRPQQQQMVELQKKLDILLQEHAFVEAENERLKTRLRVIEAVLPVREQQARWAQSMPFKPTKAAPQPYAILASLLDIASGPSSCSTSPARLEPARCSFMGEDSAAERKPQELAAASPPHAATSEAAAPCASSCSDQPKSSAAGAAMDQGAASRPGPHPHSESEARWLDAWRAWVREASLLVHAYDARPNDHYLRRMDEAFMKLKAEVVYLGLKHPELVCNMRCVNLEMGAEQEVPPDSYWPLVVAGMRLTPTQVANCKSALALYRERMDVVLAERRGLTAQLASCLGAMQLDDDGCRSAPGGVRREQLLLEVEEVTTALDVNVASEGHTTALARDLLGSSLFSRLQVARASVLSYPYFPDALAIITAAVEEEEPSGAKGSEGAV